MKVNFNRIIIPSSKDNILNLFTKFIQCKICMNILNDPHDCLCCNQTFCKSCIINYIKTNNKCPFSEFFEIKKENKNNNINELMSKIKPSSSNFFKVIQSLKFYCHNKEKGCHAELNIEEISEHEKICKYSNKNSKTNYNLKKEKNKTKEKINDINNELKENKNKHLVVKRNKFCAVKSQNDIFKQKDNTNIEEISRNTNRKNTISSINNQLIQQDSIISFCDLKNYSDGKNSNTNQSSNNQDKEKIDKKDNLNNLKLERSMEEINQKLSVINKFITNKYELNFGDGNYFKLNNNNIDKNSEKEVSEFNIRLDSENDKAYKSNSMAITNNYYDGSYINTINNYSNLNSNDKLNKTEYFDTTKTTTKKIPKNKVISLNLKSNNKTSETSTKTNKYQKYLKYKKNTIPPILTSNNKKNKIKNLNISTESNNKDKDKTKNIKETKADNIIKRNTINCTPKLGSKSKKNTTDNNNMSIEINNSIYGQNDFHSPMEEIFISIKNLENKINSIEKIIQSNNCLKNQEYSIQNDDIKEKKDLNFVNENNNNNLNEEKITKILNELINKKEESFKNVLKEQIDSFKNYIDEKCITEMQKSIFDTTIDLMGLYNDKLDEFEKVINKYYKSNDNQESKEA